MKTNFFSYLLNYFILVWILILYENVEGIKFKADRENIILECNNIQEVILNCPYELDRDDEKGLVISWFYNDIPYPIYQWIPFMPPQALGFLKDFIDLTYEASQEDFYRHRTIRIISPHSNFSGKYECKVSSFNEEKTYIVYLVLFSVPSAFEMDVERFEHSVNVRCDVGMVYPEPRLFLYRSIHSKRVPLRDGRLETKWSEGVYNVTTEAQVEDVQLDGITEFECHLNVPETNISMLKRIKYIPRIERSSGHHMHLSNSAAGTRSFAGGIRFFAGRAISFAGESRSFKFLQYSLPFILISVLF